MAIITKLPAQTIIDGFKGTLDYYVYMGLNCVRRWPKKRTGGFSEAEMSGWAPFAYASGEWNNVSIEVKRTYAELATGSALHPKDMFMRAYLSGLYRAPLP